jgi:hypothetical protein
LLVIASLAVMGGAQAHAESPAPSAVQPSVISASFPLRPLDSPLLAEPLPVVEAVTPGGGPTAGGAHVIIKGHAFTTAVEVRVGGIQLTEEPSLASKGTFRVAGETEIEVDTPEHEAESRDPVVVRTLAGTSATPPNCNNSPACFSFGLPVVEAVSPALGAHSGVTPASQQPSACEGIADCVIVSGANFGAEDTARWESPGGGTHAVNIPGERIEALSSEELRVRMPPEADEEVRQRVTGNLMVIAQEVHSPLLPGEGQFTYVERPFLASAMPLTGALRGGTRVTLDGQLFEEATEVRFGEVALTAAAPSEQATGNTPPGANLTPGHFEAPRCEETKGTNAELGVLEGHCTLVADTPPHHRGDARIAVITPGGEDTTKQAEFPRFNFGEPQVTAITPPGGPSEGGSHVRISGRDLESEGGKPTVVFGAGSGEESTVPESEVNVASGDELEVVSPAHGQVPVGVVVTRSERNSEGEVEALSSSAGTGTYDYGPIVTSISPVAGPTTGTGGRVLIRGEGFERCPDPQQKLAECTESLARTEASAVEFDGLPASFEVVPNMNGTEIEAQPPPHAVGSVDVTVSVGAAQSPKWADDTFTYESAPVVSAVEPGGGVPGGENQVVVKGENLEGASAVRFGEVASKRVRAVSGSAGGALEATVPPSPGGRRGVADVTVTTPSGTSSVSAADRYAYGLPIVEEVAPKAGLGAVAGGLVTIRGRDLEDATEVRFEAIAAHGIPSESIGSNSIVLDEPHELVVAAPLFNSSEGLPEFPAKGTMHVRVVDSAGESAMSDADTISFGGPPEVSKVANGEGKPDGSTAGGETVRIYGAQFVSCLGPAGTEAAAAGNCPPGRETVQPSSVMFGETPAKIVSVRLLVGEFYEIQVTTPPHPPGVVDTTVELPGHGHSRSSYRDRFRYLAPGEPAPRETDGEALSIAPESFEASACRGIDIATCGYLANPREAFTQAAGQPPYLNIGFGIGSFEPLPEVLPSELLPLHVLRSVRLDLPEGMSINPNAVPRCPRAVFEGVGNSFDHCPYDTVVGVVRAMGAALGTAEGADTIVYPALHNLEPRPGTPVELGFNYTSTNASDESGKSLVFIKGGVSSHREPAAEESYSNGEPQHRPNGLVTGNYHEFATAELVPDLNAPAVWESLSFFGNALGDGFVTLPSECSHGLTYHLTIGSYFGGSLPHGPYEHEKAEGAEAFTTSPWGVTGCNADHHPPFEPDVEVTPENTQPDQPDGATIRIKVPRRTEPADAAPRTVKVRLPEGMTLDPSLANALTACSNEQFGILPGGEGEPEGSPPVIGESAGHEAPDVCPEQSKMGTFAVETPVLPAGSLRGSVYAATPIPGEGPESGGTYRIFLDAEAPSYGVDVRLEGRMRVNERTGRLEAIIDTPQLPFSESTITLNGGEHAPLANPLACEGGASGEGVFAPFGGEEGGKLYPEDARSVSPFELAGCPFSAGFGPTQTTTASPAGAGDGTTFAITFSRAEGEQYLTGTSTTLPEGLVASIASVPTLCSEAQANSAACPPESQVGTVTTLAGDGTDPYRLEGRVYLTGPYAGAPYGLAIVLPADHVGPYDLGTLVARATISVDPDTTRVTTATVRSFDVINGVAHELGTPVPTILGGVPTRIRSITVTFDRPGFMSNPTYCGPLSVGSTLTGTESPLALHTVPAAVSSALQPSGCGALGWPPSFSAATAANASRANGATLEVTLAPGPHAASAKEVQVTLPAQLASRLTTLQGACGEAQFAAGPSGCPAPSRVATATLETPLLPGKLTGYGYLVSHGGRDFPDLDFVLQGDGITLREVSHTSIVGGVTRSTFTSLPDAPFSSFHVVLPEGPFSLLGATEDLCKKPLIMPVQMVAHDGATFAQNTRVAVSGCRPVTKPRVKILHHAIRKGWLFLTVSDSQGGALVIRGRGVETVAYKALPAGRQRVRARIKQAGIALARRHRKARISVTLVSSGMSASSRIKVKL